MRVVAGRFRGRSLVGPRDEQIRPTSDRLRETLFNVLEHRFGGVDGFRVIDLFAGTGALGIEALSRGAAHALFVDDGAEARATLRANIEALGLGGITRVFRRDARKLGQAPSDERFDLAFLDPPYGCGLAEPTLAGLCLGNWLQPHALVVVEEANGVDVRGLVGLELVETRESGISRLTFLRRNAQPNASEMPSLK